ncbi:alpha/beta fold hydrolase [Sandaracinobacteroides saxicola]|uniref:Alpha/beta fold hydrolase n=1 Tax=Sandaracinobacteroides saxicola TaxID=2759707 RepID=A0A7G5IDW9_9SPHN|nr:alpha/beta hydrolase [Sandaracinobacteroides saxicola]QMW21561.1 alpha/beta fold hydrolase [Sandaracinobacteroides saxicola]
MGWRAMMIAMGLALATPMALSAETSSAVPPSLIEPGPCPIKLDPAKFECGTLVASMTRKAGDDRVVRLPFAVFKPFPSTSKASAITLLAGGPGFTTIGSAGPVGPSFAPLGRDVVFLERRGTGLAEPSLACPPGTRLPNHDWDLAKVAACAKGFRDRGVDLNAFVARQAAADLEDLRILLGYRQWDILGVSSGSSLAFAVMRDFPGSVRSVIHDSPYPYGINSFATNVAKHLDKFSDLFDACARDAACGSAYPDLRATMIRAVTDLQARPLVDGTTRVDGQEVLRRLSLGLQEADALPRIPAMVAAAAGRDLPALIALRSPSSIAAAVGDVPADRVYVVGTWLSVECAERLPLFKTEDTRTREAWPASLRALMRVEWGAQDRAACRAWGYRPEPRSIDRPVTADIPTLVMLGAFDPQTPQSWGERGIAAMPKGAGRVVVIPAAGHAVTTLPCPQALVGQFLIAPRAPLDTSCLATMTLVFKRP